jgi:KRAB domain-containing zinc finger protein
MSTIRGRLYGCPDCQTRMTKEQLDYHVCEKKPPKMDDEAFMLNDFDYAEAMSATADILEKFYCQLCDHLVDCAETRSPITHFSMEHGNVYSQEDTLVISIAGKSVTQTSSIEYCLLCNKNMPNGVMLIKHMTVTHGVSVEQSSLVESENSFTQFCDPIDNLKQEMGEYDPGPFLPLNNVKQEISEDHHAEADFHFYDDEQEEDMEENDDEDFAPMKAKSKQKRVSKIAKAIDSRGGSAKGCICPACGASYAKQQRLMSHIRDNHPEEIFKLGDYICRYCDVEHKTSEEYRAHLESTHPAGLKYHLCSHCDDKFFPLPFSLTAHLTKMHSNEAFTCHICPSYFKNPREVDKHVLTAHPGANFPCHLCDSSMKDSGALTHHVYEMHLRVGGRKTLKQRKRVKYINGEFVVTTPEEFGAAKSAANNPSKQSHKRRNEDDEAPESKKQRQSSSSANNYAEQGSDDDATNDSTDMDQKAKPRGRTPYKVKLTCAKCGDQYGTQRELNRHLEESHDGSTCAYCGVEMFNDEHYEQHINDFHPDAVKYHKCIECQTFFFSSEDLTKHIPTAHPENSLYTCPLGCESFSGEDALDRHLYESHQTFQLECEKCNMEVTNTKTLRMHDYFIHLKSPESAGSRGHACLYCSTITATVDELRGHVLEKHEDKKEKHLCYVCEEIILNPASLQRHIGLTHKGKEIPCNICGKAFNRLKQLRLHMNKFHENNSITFKCRYCFVDVDTCDNYKAHLEDYHPQALDYHSCKYCDLFLVKAAEMMRHRHLAHAYVAFPCTTCGQQFDREITLENHIKKEHPDKGFGCHRCPAKLKSLQRVRRHDYEVHLKEQTDEGVIRCNYCRANFADNAYKDHLARDHPDKLIKHTCQICNRFFASLHSMSRHTRYIHTNDVVFCELCGKDFKNKFNLKSHIFHMHTQDKEPKYFCDLCDYVGTSSSTFHAHKRGVHGPKTFVCEQCGTGFSTKGAMERHTDTVHLRKKRCRCETCGKEFPFLNTLNYHIKEVHLGIKRIKCPTCCRRFKDQECIDKHLESGCDRRKRKRDRVKQEQNLLPL